MSARSFVTVAPHCTASELVRGLNPFSDAPDDQVLAEPWNPHGGTAAWFSRGTSALGAIIAVSASSGRHPTLWVPDYFCNSGLAEARRRGAEIVFYPIDVSLEPDWDACDALAREHRPDFFLIVHYFGRAADGDRAKSFCSAHGARLIEDCAHVLRPSDRIGGAGDYVFYSPYKWLPVPDGGLLIARELQHSAGLLEEARRAPRARGEGWLARKLAQRLLPPAAVASLSPRQTALDLDLPGGALCPPGLSTIARRMIVRQSNFLEKIAATRLDIARRLIALEWPTRVRPFDAFVNSEVPYRFVIDCQDIENARTVFKRLAAAGCPVESWPDLPPELKARERVHRRAIELRYRLLLLPVHQSVDADALSSMIRTALRS